MFFDLDLLLCICDNACLPYWFANTVAYLVISGVFLEGFRCDFVISSIIKILSKGSRIIYVPGFQHGDYRSFGFCSRGPYCIDKG